MLLLLLWRTSSLPHASASEGLLAFRFSSAWENRHTDRARDKILTHSHIFVTPGFLRPVAFAVVVGVSMGQGLKRGGLNPDTPGRIDLAQEAETFVAVLRAASVMRRGCANGASCCKMHLVCAR